MSCCLNHCIIAALIHFLACPHSHSFCWLAKIREEWNGARGFALIAQISDVVLEAGGRRPFEIGLSVNGLPVERFNSLCRHKRRLEEETTFERKAVLSG